MTILIAPDKFKGSLNAREVAENIALGLRDVLTNANIDTVPVADGGEGTAEVVCHALQGEWMKCNAHDPFGREIECRYAYIDMGAGGSRVTWTGRPERVDEPGGESINGNLAVIEMSEAAGMRRLAQNERDPLRATTFGVGEMILDAARRGAREIIVGLGGSATNDGGFGMARALDFRFFGQDDYENEQVVTPHLPPSCNFGATSNPLPLRRGEGKLRSRELELLQEVSELGELTRIKKPQHLSLPKIVAAADVRNPLLGENGATRVFGPQKGATAEQVDVLERALTRFADVIARDFHRDVRNQPGAGAAGGLGFGLMSFCGANMRPGFEVVAQAIDLESKIKDVDIVITGEGSLDAQTLEGKTPAGVARLARKLGKRIFAIVGRAAEDRKVRDLFDRVYVLAHSGMSKQESIARANELLRERARELAADLKKTFNVE